MKNILFSNVKDFRYERKFYVDGLAGGEIEVALRHHPEAFGRIYHPRIVNNIYFDSVNMQHYFDNLGGVDRRIKSACALVWGYIRPCRGTYARIKS